MNNHVFLRKLKGTKDFPLKQARMEDYRTLCNVCQKSSCSDNLDYLVGDHVLGPMLYGFSTWFHQRIAEKGSKRLVFLSREGKIMRDGFLALYGDEIQTDYLHVSRLSLCRGLAARTRNGNELLELFMPFMRNGRTVNRMMEILGMPEEVDWICQQLGCTPETAMAGVDQDQWYRLVMDKGLDYLIEQNRNMEAHLRDMQIYGDEILLVDIGWSGTMQLLLSKAVPGTKFVGYYFAVTSFQLTDEYAKLERYGYWCDDSNWSTHGNYIRFGLTAVEELFMSDECSTIGYDMKCGKAVPVFENVSLSEQLLMQIEDLHHGAMDFLHTAKQINSELDSYVCMWPYMNLTIYPSRKSIEFFRDRTFSNGVYRSTILPQHALAYYITHPHDLKKELNENIKKVLFFRALFRLPLPYFKILCFLVDRVGMKSSFSKELDKIQKKEDQTK